MKILDKTEDGNLDEQEKIKKTSQETEWELKPQYREDRKASGRAGNQDRHRAGQMAFHGNRQNAPK